MSEGMCQVVTAGIVHVIRYRLTSDLNEISRLISDQRTQPLTGHSTVSCLSHPLDMLLECGRF
jgi:hypothetical protein